MNALRRLKAENRRQQTESSFPNTPPDLLIHLRLAPMATVSLFSLSPLFRKQAESNPNKTHIDHHSSRVRRDSNCRLSSVAAQQQKCICEPFFVFNLCFSFPFSVFRSLFSVFFRFIFLCWLKTVLSKLCSNGAEQSTHKSPLQWTRSAADTFEKVAPHSTTLHRHIESEAIKTVSKHSWMRYETIHISSVLKLMLCWFEASQLFWVP